VNRRILPLALCLVLVGLLAPASVRGADGWSVSANADLVHADFISQSGSGAQLYLENNDSITPFNIPEAGAVLDALGFGGGYSQEVSWGSGAGPAVSCPIGLTDLFSFCSTNTGGGWALIPDGLRTELSLTATASGNRAFDVRPSLRSLAYDGTVAAIGIALETLSPGPIVSNAAQVASLAVRLLPEAAGFEAAMGRKDSTAAGFELLALSKRAMTIIGDHITDWAIGGIVDLIPGIAEVKLGIAVSKAVVVLANFDAHLLAGNSVTSMTVGYGGGGGPVVARSPTANAGTFSPTGSMINARWNYTATLLSDGRVLVAGGEAGAGAYSSAELYDPKTGSFSSTGSMATARASQTATLLLDGRVLVAGGHDGQVALASAELYDPKTGTFSPTGSMPADADEQTAIRLADGRVLLAGGLGAGGGSSAELYDPKTGTFSTTGSTAGVGEYGDTATLLSDGRVLIVGGISFDSATASAELYDPKTGTFSPTGPMTTPRSYHTATLLKDGRVLIAGGSTVGDSVVASAELYDPKTGTFSPTGSMTTARIGQTATLLPDGRVLLAGGGNPCSAQSCVALASAELYDPKTGTFSPTGSMTTARADGAATLLFDGRVLLAGGMTITGGTTPSALSSAELFQP
jgi:hypothetical protein